MLTLFNPNCSKTRLRHYARASARCEFSPDIAILIGLIFSRDSPHKRAQTTLCDFLQVKLGRERNFVFLLNEHGDPHFLMH